MDTLATKIASNKPPQPEGFLNPQLDLFQKFVDEGSRNRFSNTIELWDAIPKYSVSRQRQNRLRQATGGLDPVTMVFHHRGQPYVMTLYPAKVQTRDGKWVEYFPAEQEELVEDALRKLAAERGQGFYDNHGPGVVFTSKQIIHLLDGYEHGIRHTPLLFSLHILLGTRVFISRAGEKKSFFASTILTELGAVSREDWRKDPSAKWYVRFNSLIEACIQAKTYRQFDFAKMMAHSSQLARWLYKRMAHLYRQASLIDPYRISLVSVKRDSGLLNASSLRFDARSLEKALEEMKE
ncbi:MAG: hypothetical protein N3A55_10930, partial [Methylohalobius sp.]|nr:hypothetical protein [Methylohalobius sp.]